jgi:alkylation response protein AidB-like acyl-CoA dehydrogenase
MSDGFLVLAQIHDDKNLNQSSTNGIPSCFFVPRWLPNGERNPFYIQRLKDKLGNRSNASSEIEFNNTQAVSTYLFFIQSNFEEFSSGYWEENMMVLKLLLK